MDKGRELIEALALVSREKGLDKEIIFEAIETSLLAACKKHFGPNANIRASVSRETGDYAVYAAKTVSEEVEDAALQITLEDAREINSKCELGDVVELVVTPKNFGRIAAMNARQVVVTKFREAEREMIFDEFSKKEGTVVTGVVQRKDRRNVFVSLGRIEALLPAAEQIAKEGYQFQERLKVFVLSVSQHVKGPMVTVSRTNPDLVRQLFRQEVAEVADGIVEIKSVAREPGFRSKIAVFTKFPHIEPVGSCVGPNGQRVNAVSKELRGEKIDIVLWNEDPARYISNALSPCKVAAVAVNPLEMDARVVVPDAMLSLAIGKEGQNARLAAKLTGWRIDIRSESDAKGTDFLIFPELEEMKRQEAEKRKLELEAAYANYYNQDAEAADGAHEEYYYDDEYDEYDEYYDDEYGDDDYDDYYDYDDGRVEAAAKDVPNNDAKHGETGKSEEREVAAP